MEHIKNLLSKRVRQSGLSSSIQNALVIEEFVKIVQEIWGDKIAKKIKPIYLKNKKMIVSCSNSVIAQDVNFNRDRIIESLNNKFNAEVVQKVILVI